MAQQSEIENAIEAFKKTMDSAQVVHNRASEKFAAAVSIITTLGTLAAWWGGVMTGEGLVLTIPPAMIWLVALLGSNALIWAWMRHRSFKWRVHFEDEWSKLWTAQLSLVPEVIPTESYIDKAGTVHFTLRVLNRGPRRWFIDNVDGLSASVQVGDNDGRRSEAAHEGVQSLTVEPWEPWKQMFCAASTPQSDRAVEVNISNMTLWIRPDDGGKPVSVRLPPQNIWIPVRRS